MPSGTLLRFPVFLSAVLTTVTCITGVTSAPAVAAGDAVGTGSAASAVTGLSVTPSTTAAGASEVDYTVDFTASPTGGLVASQGTVTLALPAGSVFNRGNAIEGLSMDVQDLTTGQNGMSFGFQGSLSDGAATFTGLLPIAIAARDKVRITYTEVANAPVTGLQTASFSTSSDTTPVTAPCTLTSGSQRVSALSVSESSTAAGASEVDYTVDFTASPTGGLVASQGTVTLALPAGSVFIRGNFFGGLSMDVQDLTTGQNGSSFGFEGSFSDGAATFTCPLPIAIAARDKVRITYTEVANAPVTGLQTASFSTSSDTAPVTASFTLTPPSSVAAPTAALSTQAPGAAGTYQVGFTTSAGGGLAANNGAIVLAAPAGTVFGPGTAYSIADFTSGRTATVRGSASSGGATVTLTVPFAIDGGDQVAVTATGVTNPTAAGSDVMRISTTSDTVPAATPAYPVGPSMPVFTAAAPPLAAAPGAHEQYTFGTTGYPEVSYSLTGAPAWLSINAGSGRLSGTVPPGTRSFSYSVRAANSAGSAVEGPYTVTVGAATSVSGSVVNGAGDPVTNVTVDACDPADATCESATTDAGSAFSVTVLAGAATVLTAYPPPGSGVTTASTGVLTVPAGGLTGETITVQASIPPIQGTLRINGSASPLVYWGSPSAASLTDCPDGLATVSVIGENTQTGKYDATTTPLTETPAGSGNYTGTIPPEEPVHGPVQFESAISCPPAVQLAPASRSAAARANSVSAAEIGSSIYSDLDSIAEIADEINLLITTMKEAAHPDCSTIEEASVEQIMAIMEPAVSAFARVVTPEIEELLGATFPELIPLLLLPATAFVIAKAVETAIDWVLEQAVTALVQAFYSSYCAAPPPRADGLVDPSGTVLDTNGHPVNGATVTILRSYTKDGAYLPVSPSAPGILPAVNPQMTGADGVFHWDVAAGFYKVEASAPGCTAPGSARTTAVIGPYPVPPPQLGLSITLQCKNERPAAAPEVTSLSQESGPSNGGTVLTVLGANFTPSSTVTFGDLPAKAVTYMSPEALTVTTPEGYGLVDVRVKTAGGTSAKNPADIFFFGSAPTVTKASPARGPASGGTTVTITGTGFAGVTEVSFGGVPARKFTVLSATTIIAVTGKALPGPVTVQVINPAGISPADPAAAFSYLASATPATASPGPVRRSPGVPTVG
jgi:hypothetical protein